VLPFLWPRNAGEQGHKHRTMRAAEALLFDTCGHTCKRRGPSSVSPPEIRESRIVGGGEKFLFNFPSWALGSLLSSSRLENWFSLAAELCKRAWVPSLNVQFSVFLTLPGWTLHPMRGSEGTKHLFLRTLCRFDSSTHADNFVSPSVFPLLVQVPLIY
jgi:hypothetical protein